MRILENLIRDLRFAVRSLRQRPGFAAVAILTLAVSIGASTALFGVVDALLLRSLPVKEPDRLILLGEAGFRGIYGGRMPHPDLVSYPDFLALSEGLEPEAELFAVGSGSIEVYFRRGSSDLIRAKARLVSGNYFEALGVKPNRGRFLNEDDAAARNPVAVLSHAFWERQFNGSPEALGEAITINGLAYTIVGVAPPGFTGERVAEEISLWTPLTLQADIMRQESFLNNADTGWLWVFGRLRPGETPVGIQAKATTLFRSIATSHFGDDLDETTRQKIANLELPVRPAGRGISGPRRNYSESLLTLMALVGALLLIACVNIASLLLARGTARKKELAVRSALGAGRGRLIQQLLIESLLLAVAGGLCGVALAYLLAPAIPRLLAAVNAELPLEVVLDQRTLLFAVGVTTLTGLLFGLAPAFARSKIRLASAIASEGRGSVEGGARLTVRQGLVSVQVAMAIVLLVGASLLLRTLQQLQKNATGFDVERVLVADIDPRQAGYAEADLQPLFERLVSRAENLPGALSAAAASYPMVTGSRAAWYVGIEGFQPETAGDEPNVWTDIITPGFLETLQISLLEGRTLTDSATPVREALVNRAFAERYFENRSPLGATVRFLGGSDSDEAYEVVGVIGNTKRQGLREKTPEILYLPLAAKPDYLNALFVRLARDPATAAAELRAAINEVSPDLPVASIRTMQAQVDRNLADERLLSRISALFGAIALALAAVGLFGVLSQNVLRRTTEVGVRKALGATSGAVLRLILGQALLLVAIGAVAGVVAAVGVGRLLKSLLFGIEPWDPVSVVIAVTVMLVAGVVAALLPALRAARVAPMQALREL